MIRRFNGIEELVEAIRELDEHQVQPAFDGDWDGSCPCFDGKAYVSPEDGGNGVIDLHGTCWRVAEHGEQDLFVSQDSESSWRVVLTKDDLEQVGKALKEKLDAQEWYGKYRVILSREGSR